ncbi:MAG: DUF3316 domain-containing protein [Lachnoclostridium sp.]|nr:DUF3316 domain-containing protein [Lachnoclostridium sp.]
MKRIYNLLIAVIVAVTALPVMAAEADSVEILRPVRAAYTAEIGSSHLADTYLTPLRYDGIHAALAYQRYQAMKFAPERWTMSLTLNLGLDKADNPARNATMWNLALDADWGMMHRWRVHPLLTLAAGGSTTISAGALYNARNGNNPVSAKASWTVDVTGYAACHLTIGHLPVTIVYRPTIPVTGVFFSPDYGELYYEIYLGNHSGLCHGAWWGNYFRMDNLLTADLEFGATYLRVGYHGGIFSSKVNDITTNVFTHSFVVGISGEWLSLNPRKPRSCKSRIVQAIY